MTDKTRADLETKIADDLARDDLTTQITEAVDTAIRAHENDRYWFNEKYAVTATLSTSTASMELTTFAYTFLEFDRVRLVRTASTYWDLIKRDYSWVMDRQDVLVTTQPLEYTVYNDSLHFDAYADQNYPIIVDGIISLANLASASFSQGDTAAWFNAARDMIRASAKKEIWLHVLDEPDKAGAMASIEMSQHDKLLAKTNQKTSTGIIRPVEW